MSLLLNLLLYLALLLFVAGLLRQLIVYSRTPQPLKVPTMPAPRTRIGVVGRLTREVVLFESLFKASVWTWVFSWLFHAGLVFTLLVHLRYVSDPTWSWVAVLIPFNKVASACMIVGLTGLLARRCVIDRVRVISTPSDYLMLIFLLCIPITGIAMRLFTNTDYIAVTTFARALVRLVPQVLDGHWVLTIHIILVCALLLVFPFSKLLHAPGVFFSPSRNQRDNSRSDGKGRASSRRSNSDGEKND